MAKNNEAGNTERDMFIAEFIFPEPSFVFKFKPSSLVDIKKHCLIVLDTSVLLAPYLTGKESLKDIKKVYQQLIAEKRLLIPAQASREFSKNRAEKIGEIFQFIKQKKAKINGNNIEMNEYPLLDELPEYQEMMEIRKTINKNIQDLCVSMDKVTSCIQNWNWNDPVSLIYSELGFSEIVYELNFEKDKIKSELEKRYLHDIPPGYKDSAKGDQGVGDFIIWKTILDLGKKHKKPIIFVSGDEKPDWRHKREKEVLYPRYELIDEYRRETGGETFHLIKFSEFLKLFDVEESTVNEVKRIENESVKEEALSFSITEDEFINKIYEYQEQTHDNYIGLRKFQEFLRDRHVYDSYHSKEVLENLIEKGDIELYDAETSKGIPAKAIRIRGE